MFSGVHRPVRRLRLPDGATPGAALCSEHPHVEVERAPGSTGDVAIDADAWRHLHDFRDFDERFARASSDAIVVRGPGSGELAAEILTRWQRHLRRTNAASATPLFARALEAHLALHDLSKPLVAADYDHAIDTWQWLLRLDPSASLAVQLAALFHDIERLSTEPDVRIEQHAADYQAFKDAHARSGAAWSRAVLLEAQVPEVTAQRVHALIAGHEHRVGDEEAALLSDADALSFFSLNSAGYADYFSPEQTAKKVAWTQRRLSWRARQKLRFVKLRPDVARLLQGERA